MISFDEADKIAAGCGFTHRAYLDCGTLKLLDEVREMCKANTCGMYGKNLACPPACGTLDECQEQVKRFRWGILLQTVGAVEDSLDFEGMVAVEAKHKAAFQDCAARLRQDCPELLPLGCGCCTVCPQCAGPGAPCRFPDRRVSSMEAYGIVVSDICAQNGMKYYYGPGTIAYTSCCLIG